MQLWFEKFNTNGRNCMSNRFLKSLRPLCLLLGSFCGTELQAKPFVIGDVCYQLGNQMFQIAAAVAVARDFDFDPYFPNLDTSPHWEIPENRKYVLWRLNGSMPEGEVEHIHRDSGGPVDARPNMQMFGFYQSERYFAHHKEEILELFAPTEEIVEEIFDKYGALLEEPCTVGVHVRTFIKDYGRLPNSDEVHAFPGVEYYENAVKHFPEDALFLICSDNIPWCKENLSHIAPNIVFIEGNKHHFDFYLMTLCDHNIIANSTFSWWCAYLNRNPEKIVTAPAEWAGSWWLYQTNNILLEDWVRVPTQNTAKYAGPT